MDYTIRKMNLTKTVETEYDFFNRIQEIKRRLKYDLEVKKEAKKVKTYSERVKKLPVIVFDVIDNTR